MTVTPIGRFCEAWHPDTGTCGMAAIAIHDYGCIHEHVLLARATCAEHAPEKDRVGCKKCREMGHDCPVTFRPTGER